MDYLSGMGSLNEICKKYSIPSDSQLRQWIKRYNGHEKLKASGTGETAIMTNGRKTTIEERIEIAAYCIAHDHNYAETAEKYKVSFNRPGAIPLNTKRKALKHYRIGADEQNQKRK